MAGPAEVPPAASQGAGMRPGQTVTDHPRITLNGNPASPQESGFTREPPAKPPTQTAGPPTETVKPPEGEVNRDSSLKDPKEGEAQRDTTSPVLNLKDFSVLLIAVVDASDSMRPWLRDSNLTFSDFPGILSVSLNWKAIFIKGDGKKGFLKSRGSSLFLEDRGWLLKTKLWTPDLGRTVFTDTLSIHSEGETGFGFRKDQGGNVVVKGVCELPPGCQMGWNEKPLESLEAALLRDMNKHRNKHKEYIKAADIVVGVVMSDSDEGVHSRPEKRVTAERVVSVFSGNYPGKPFLGYGIIMTREDPGCRKKWKGRKERRAGYGDRIAELAEITGGENFSLCASDYTALAQQIVSDVERKARLLP